MLDIFNLSPGAANTQIFNMPCGTTEWHTWIKPRGVSMIYMVCMGSGSGAGGGESNSAGLWRNGGGGGGSAGFSRLLVPAFLVPDKLYVQVAKGGAGGGELQAGSNGANSYISITPATTTAHLYLVAHSTSNGPTGANAGTAGSSSAGGTGASVATAAMCPLSNTGYFYATAGQGGGAGAAAAANGNAVTWSGVNITCGGGGGGGITNTNTNGIGGGITGAAYVPTIQTSNNFDKEIPSSGGFMQFEPFAGIGGCGGSSLDFATIVPNGGIGGWGSGGGGGGAASSSSGGRGGDGGPGLVIIISW